MIIPKKMKVVKPTKKMSTIDLLNSKQEKITNAISKVFNESIEVDGMAPHVFFEKEACKVLARVFKTDKDLRENLRFEDKQKARKNEYPDFPVVVDKNGRRYAIDIKSSAGLHFCNDIAPLVTYTESRYNQFHGEWILALKYKSKRLNRSEKAPRYSVSLKKCVFGETHTFALVNKKTGIVTFGGNENSVRPIALRKYSNGKINTQTREQFRDSVEHTIERMSRKDPDFRAKSRQQKNRYIKRISK